MPRTPQLWHPTYGALIMTEGLDGLSNQWTNFLAGVRYGTFLDSRAWYLALPLDEVILY